MKALLAEAFVLCGLAAAVCAGPVWEDPAGPDAQRGAVAQLKDGSRLRVDAVAENLLRVRRTRGNVWTESGMNRYGVLKRDFAPCAAKAEGQKISTARAALAWTDDGALTFTGCASPLAIQPELTEKGFAIRFALAKGERIYGIGDVCRDTVMRRGRAYDLWVKNVTTYIPVPMALSRNGWGVLLDSTWRNRFDVGKSDPDAMILSAPEGNLDFYLFCGKDYRELLDIYTQLTGRPALLPVWGYGFTYVNNQFIDSFNLVNDAMRFREQDFPCDVLGLEPGWMETFYDFTTKKQWSKARFYFPYWAPRGDHTFVGALKRKGFKLSLWLCCDYDLSRYEEQLRAGNIRKAGGTPTLPEGIPETWNDDRITGGKAVENRAAENKNDAPEGTQPWFEHLKYFVDQGAACFKLDGARQVDEHPERKYANGMNDEEMHNLYPLLYGKQMARGFEEHTQQRAMVYSAGGYAGIQQFVATWAGDTGGGAKPLASMLNLAFSGHSNHSCDMEVRSVAGIHFGFLQTWAQQNNWDYWNQPWLNDDALIPAFREYDHLRYRLLPYLYSEAAEAALTGWPVMRAMPMVWPDDPSWDDCLGQYMLGDFLLVSAYVPKVRVPEGTWYDFWTGEEIKGPCERAVKTDARHGGALLVKRGAILPTAAVTPYVSKGWTPQVTLLVWPGETGSFTLYEDDGVSLEYRSGAYAQTPLACENKADKVTLTIGPRKGKYNGMPATRAFEAVVRLDAEPKGVSLDGQAVTDAKWDAAAQTLTVKIPACGGNARTVELSK